MLIHLVHDRCFPLRTNIEAAGAFILFGLILCGVIWLNISEYKRRKKLTPEERAEEDRIAAIENQVW